MDELDAMLDAAAAVLAGSVTAVFIIITLFLFWEFT